MSFFSTYNYESYLKKTSENFQSLIKDLIQNQKLQDVKQGKNCGVQCSEKELKKKNLKRGRFSTRQQEQDLSSQIF